MDRFRRPSPMSKAIARSPQSGIVTAPVPSPPAKPGMPGQVRMIPGLIEDPRTITGAEITRSPGALDEARFNAPPPPPLRAKVPRVALLLPLSGPHAKLGNSLLNAAQLALFHFAGKNFELLPQDTQGTPEERPMQPPWQSATGLSHPRATIFKFCRNRSTSSPRRRRQSGYIFQ